MGGARESVFALERAQDRRFRISQRINRLEDQGVGVAQLRTKLGELTTSYGQRQFGTARQLSRELERQVALTEQRARRERDYQRALARSARIGGPSEPVRGRVDLAGSPRFLEAQQREAARLAREQAAAERTRRQEAARAAREQARLDRAAAAARQAEIREGLRIGRLNTSPVSGRLINGRVIPGSPADIERQSREAAVRGPALPVSGRLINGQVVPGSPADRARRSRAAGGAGSSALQEAIGNAIIGGAFPALFGQGLGASVGGAAGGFGGGLLGGNFGFGLSLVGTAAGAQFDLAIQKLGTLGSALNDPINQFGALAEAGLLSSRSVEKQVQALIDTGREAEAAALIQKDLANTYGDLQSAKDLAVASNELNRSWSELQVSAAALVAEPLAQLLEEAASGVVSFAEALRKLKDAIPEPVRNAGTGLIRTAANFTIGSGFNIVQGVGRLANRLLPGSGAPNTNGQAGDTAAALAAETRQNDLRQLRLRLITAESQDQEQLALTLKRQTVELEKQVALENSKARNEPPIKQQQIAAQFNEQLLRIDERRLELERQRTREVRTRADVERRAEAAVQQLRADFAVSLRQAQNNTSVAADDLYVQRRRATEGFGNLGEQALRASFGPAYAKQELEVAQLALQAADTRAVNAQREALILGERISTLQKEGASYSQITDAIEASKQAALQAESARNDYVIASEALKQAGINVATAAFKAKNEFTDLLRSAEAAVQNITRSIEDSTLQLQQLQNTRSGGLNEFMSAQQVSDRQAALADQLRPIAQEIAKRRNLNFSLSGTNEDRNNAILRLIQADRQQTRIEQDISRSRVDLGVAQSDLATVNQSLVTVNTDLATATQALADKDWNVYVSVPGGNASGDVVREGVYQ